MIAPRTFAFGVLLAALSLCILVRPGFADLADAPGMTRLPRPADAADLCRLRVGRRRQIPSATAKVTGTVTYRERLALPSNAVVQVSLQDVSLADAPRSCSASRPSPRAAPRSRSPSRSRTTPLPSTSAGRTPCGPDHRGRATAVHVDHGHPGHHAGQPDGRRDRCPARLSRRSRRGARACDSSPCSWSGSRRHVPRQSVGPPSDDAVSEKIRLDLSGLNKDGLTAPRTACEHCHTNSASRLGKTWLMRSAPSTRRSRSLRRVVAGSAAPRGSTSASAAPISQDFGWCSIAWRGWRTSPRIDPSYAE